MRHVIGGVEGTYSHTTLPMELDIAADLQKLWETAADVEDDPREWEDPRPFQERERRRKLISQDSPSPENQGLESGGGT
jgi:hypothetical protein